MKKEEFEEKLERKICDQTWYRLNAKLRQLGIRKQKDNVEYKTALFLLAELSKGTKKKINMAGFCNVWELLKTDKKLPENIKGIELKEYLLNSIPVQPSNSVFYRWFTLAGCPFRESDIYTKNEVITVIAALQNWLSKKTQGIKISTNNLSDYTPLSEILNTQGD